MSLKRVIISAFVIMTIGTLLELFLLKHYEDTLQLIPILCIGLVMATTIILFFIRTNVIKGIYKLLLLITSLGGIYGGYLHLYANYEFEVEMTPTASNWDLIMESFSGALPTLAPFSMIVLALIGYSYLILINQKQ